MTDIIERGDIIVIVDAVGVNELAAAQAAQEAAEAAAAQVAAAVAGVSASQDQTVAAANRAGGFASMAGYFARTTRSAHDSVFRMVAQCAGFASQAASAASRAVRAASQVAMVLAQVGAYSRDAAYSYRRAKLQAAAAAASAAAAAGAVPGDDQLALKAQFFG